jgi:D-glycero-D-manno-heptose 1,7-bisphosphate phosphatase
VRAAVFLDRDGTIIENPGYLSDPAGVTLLPGALEGLGALKAAGFSLVVVSNQSGIARGLYSEADFNAVTARMTELLAWGGARLDGVYHCPHHPDVTGPCECRKPRTALYERASRDLGLELSASWFVGDRVHDAEPALALGGRGLLVGARDPADGRREEELGLVRVADLRAAARHIQPGPAVTGITA